MKEYRVLLLIALVWAATSSTATAKNRPLGLQNPVAAQYGKLPLSFEPNRGQADSQVQFLAHGNGYTLFLTATEAVLSLRSAESMDLSVSKPFSLVHRNPAQLSSVRFRLLGASAKPGAEGLALLPGRSNYFIGKDPTKWRTNVPQFGRVRYRDIYPGIDVVYYGNQGRLEHDFVIAPDASPRAISLGIDGTDKSDISSQGDLVLHLPDGDVCLQKPIAYQQFGESKREVAVRYVLRGNEVSFEVGAYDRGLPLVIDPVLLYSTFLGGSKFDSAFGIAVDSTGHAYVTGQTSSTNFPRTTTRIFQGVDDVFVSKLNASGTTLLYSTYLGGSNNDRGSAIAVDGSGNAYIAGATLSTNFPTVNAFQSKCTLDSSNQCLGNAFVTKLNSTGAIVYSTYLGGSGNGGSGDSASGIAVDGTGDAFVAGNTNSIDFPTTSMSFQPNCFLSYPTGNTCGGGFLTKLSASGLSLSYSTYLSGAFGTAVSAVALDSTEHAYVVGQTGIDGLGSSTPFGSCSSKDCFVGFLAKFNSSGSASVYSDWVGFENSNLVAVAVDSSGAAYVVGSGSIPTTAGAFQPTANGGNVAKISADGSTLVYSTGLAGTQTFGTAVQAIAVDKFGQAFVTGFTSDSTFPVTSNKLQGFTGGFCGTNFRCPIGFVTTLNTSGTAIAFYSTFLGGTGSDFGNGIALDKVGNAYAAGQTASSNFPVTSGAFQTTYHGGIDAFVSKLVVAADLSITMSPSSASVVHGSNLTYNIGVFNKGPDGSDGDVLTDTIPTGTTFVSFTNTNGICTAPAIGATGILTCKRFNRLLAGHSWGPVTLTVKVQAAAGSTIINRARASSSTQDFVTANNTATVSTNVN